MVTARTDSTWCGITDHKYKRYRCRPHFDDQRRTTFTVPQYQYLVHGWYGLRDATCSAIKSGVAVAVVFRLTPKYKSIRAY